MVAHLLGRDPDRILVHRAIGALDLPLFVSVLIGVLLALLRRMIAFLLLFRCLPHLRLLLLRLLTRPQLFLLGLKDVVANDIFEPAEAAEYQEKISELQFLVFGVDGSAPGELGVQFGAALGGAQDQVVKFVGVPRGTWGRGGGRDVVCKRKAERDKYFMLHGGCVVDSVGRRSHGSSRFGEWDLILGTSERGAELNAG